MKNFIKIIIAGAVITIIGLGIYAISKNKNTDESNNTISFSNSSKEEILRITDSDNILGDKSAPITIVNYSDYQCPYCINFDKTMTQIVESYPGQVRWVYRHFPLPSNKYSKGTAIAAEAAGKQGKFWEFHNKIVEKSRPDGSKFQERNLLEYAKELGLNENQFKNDLKDMKVIAKVENDTASGTALKIKGTPASYLIDQNNNIEELRGALTFEQLKEKLDPPLNE
ncbi:MAG: thioredoxin domain-containing protein [Patescibacteria group bacterium]